MLTHRSVVTAQIDPRHSMLVVASLSVVAATFIVIAWIGLGLLLVGSS